MSLIIHTPLHLRQFFASVSDVKEGYGNRGLQPLFTKQTFYAAAWIRQNTANTSLIHIQHAVILTLPKSRIASLFKNSSVGRVHSFVSVIQFIETITSFRHSFVLDTRYFIHSNMQLLRGSSRVRTATVYYSKGGWFESSHISITGWIPVACRRAFQLGVVVVGL